MENNLLSSIFQVASSTDLLTKTDESLKHSEIDRLHTMMHLTTQLLNETPSKASSSEGRTKTPNNQRLTPQISASITDVSEGLNTVLLTQELSKVLVDSGTEEKQNCVNQVSSNSETHGTPLIKINNVLSNQSVLSLISKYRVGQ